MRTVNILLRGQHYVGPKTPHGRSGYERNFLDIEQHYRTMVVDSLLGAGMQVRHFAISYKSPYDDCVRRLAKEGDFVLLEEDVLGTAGHRQFEVVSKGLGLIPEDDGNPLLILRFDMVYKQPIAEWFDLSSDFDLVLPWREAGWNMWYEHWVPWKAKYSEKRVGDSFFFLSNKNGNLKKFRRAIGYDPRCAHEKYDDFVSRGLRVRFCVLGFYDSDTACGNSLADNPLFLLQRPYRVSA